MPDLQFKKSTSGLLPCTEEAQDWFGKLAFGTTVNAKVSVPRNAKFHAKFFKMLAVAYDNHEWPPVQTAWGEARVTKDTFREYVTVKAGYFDMMMFPDGKARARAKSIKWGKMDEAEFSKLYSAVLDVILREFLTNWKNGDMENAVNQMMEFT